MRFRSSTRTWSTTWTDSVWRRIYVSRSTRAILRARPSVIEGKPRLSKLRTWFGEQSRNRAAVSTDRYAGQVDDFGHPESRLRRADREMLGRPAIDVTEPISQSLTT